MTDDSECLHNTFLALDIDKFGTEVIDLRSFRCGRSLPVTPVTVPVEDPKSIAILSWRWDIESETGRSRNVEIALAQARRSGFRQVLIDAISVDQRLTGIALSTAIAAFSALYESLPVIAAYDDPSATGERGWLRVMRRPWILREARAFYGNSNRIVYVGYVPGQGTADSFGFRHMLDRVWQTSFTHTILYVLCGQVGMHSVSDLRFILPEHASVLGAGEKEFTRADLLLTAALLVQAQATDTRLNADIELADAAFDRYRVVHASQQGYLTTHTITLDGEPLAVWKSRYTRYDDYRRWLEVLPHAERVIHERLHLSSDILATYVANGEARRRSLQLPDHGRSSKDADIEIVNAGSGSA